MTDNVFTLDDLDAAIEREYAPLRFRAGDDEFVLRSLMRVSRKEREAVVKKLETLENADDDDSIDETAVIEAVQFVVKTICADNKGAKLVKVVGDDIVRYMKLLAMWTEATQPGEAKDSRN